MSRTFSFKQKQALLKDSGGYCRLCGVPLLAGWHADHIIPYSKGGLTNVENGQALCAACNLKKGNKMIQEETKAKPETEGNGIVLRDWQEAARVNLRDKFKNGKQCCLTHATPGGGKTIHALSVFNEMKERGVCNKLVIIAPSINLVSQWMSEAVQAYGVELKNGMLYRDCSDFNEYDGIIITYHSLVNYFEDLRNFCHKNSVLVVADEAHHAAESKAWGESFKAAFELSKHILMLTGTPWTATQTPMPFVTYGKDGRVEADVVYDKVQAIGDGVCRITECHAVEPIIRITEIHTGFQKDYEKITDATKDGVPRAYANSIRLPDNMMILFKDADRQLGELRSVTARTAGGLLVAPDIKTAHKFKDRIFQETGIEYVVVSSDDPKANEKLKAFKKSTDRWIIAVNMITEGVDIKRLQVCVFLGFAKTELFLRQVIGRIERIRVSDNLGKVDTVGYFHYLAHPEIDKIIRLIERDNEMGKLLLEKDVTPQEWPPKDKEGNEVCPDCGKKKCICIKPPPVPKYMFESMGEENKIMIARGEIYEAELIYEAMREKASSQHFNDFPLSDMCKFVLAKREKEQEKVMPINESPEILTLEEKKANIRKVMTEEIRRKVGTAKLMQSTPRDQIGNLFKVINNTLNRKSGIRSIDDDVSLDQLQKRLDHIYATEATSWIQ